MQNLSVIIVNYNTHDHLINSLSSLYSSKHKFDFEIIIVDNNSSNEEIKKFPVLFPDAKFIFNKHNVGFGEGCNIGAKKAVGKYLLFINPDITVKESSLDKLMEFAEGNENVGVVTGILIDDKGLQSYSYNNFPGLRWEFLEAFGIGRDKFIDKLISQSKSGKPFEIDWAHGACLLIRKEIFIAHNGFDENIFLYYEDVDLQRRLKESGYKNYCLPDSQFVHFTQSSVRSLRGERIYNFYMHVSKIYYYRKYNQKLALFLIRLFYITGYCFRILKLPVDRKYKEKKAEKLYHYFIIIRIYLGLLNVENIKKIY